MCGGIKSLAHGVYTLKRRAGPRSTSDSHRETLFRPLAHPTTVPRPMPESLDYLVFVAVLGLTVTLLSTNYVVFLARGYRQHTRYALATLLGSGFLAAFLLGPAMVGLGEQYGSAVILSRWGFAFGWAFLIALGASAAAVLERASEGRVAILLTIAATLLLGFTLASGLIFAEQSLPPLPVSLVNLGLAAAFTSIFKWVYERRLEKRRRKRTLFERLGDLIRG